MASNVISVVRGQLSGVFNATKDPLLVTRRLMALADEIQDAKPETASKLRAGIDLIPTGRMADSSGHSAGWYRAPGWRAAAREI